MCHSDPRYSPYSVCCPKTCKNPSDIYKDGTCYARAKMDEACDQDFQCQTQMPTSGAVPGQSGQTYAPVVCKKPDAVHR